MKTPRTLLRLLSAAAVAAAVSIFAVPATAQVSLTTLAWVGDSEGAGFSANCLTKRVQVDSPGAIMARANGADYQQPIMGDPGLGGCLVLTSLAPSFGKEPSVVKPENLTLARPYNNLSVGGCAIHDMLTATTGSETLSAGTCRNTIDLVLRNSTFHWGTMIDQANLLNPTFTVLENVGNDYLGAVLSGTVIDGITVTPVAQYTADINAAVAKLKAKQANGLVFGVADVTSIPFATTLPYFLTSGGKPVFNPATGAVIPLLGPKGCPTGVPACSIPKDTLVTLAAASYLPAGYGIPCAVAALPKCNNPLPDSQDAAGPGVLLYADEVALLKQRYADFNAATKAAAAANGYKFYDTNDFLLRMKAGFSVAGVTLNAAFLTGGLFSYDGFHLTPIGYAFLADDLTKFINANFPNTSLKEPDLAVYIYQGGTAGGLAGGVVTPFAWAPMTDAEKAFAIEQIFTPEFARDLAAMIPAHRATVTAGPAAPAQHHERAERTDPMP